MLFRYYLIIFAGKKMSTRILIALGSNHEQEKNVAFAMERLRSFFPRHLLFENAVDRTDRHRI